MDPCADREGNANGREDRVPLVESLDLDLHPGEVLLGAAHDDLAVPPVPESHDDERVDLGENLGVDVLRLLGDHAEPDSNN